LIGLSINVYEIHIYPKNVSVILCTYKKYNFKCIPLRIIITTIKNPLSSKEKIKLVKDHEAKASMVILTKNYKISVGAVHFLVKKGNP
jgi:hypothetical protein